MLGPLQRALTLFSVGNLACVLVDNPQLTGSTSGEGDGAPTSLETTVGPIESMTSTTTASTSTSDASTSDASTSDASTSDAGATTSTSDASTTIDAIECGDGTLQPPEICDGADVQGLTCESLDYGGGVIQCLPDCSGIDVGGCIGDDCCAAHEAPGCEDRGCEAAVCMVDANCCDIVWDDACEAQAQSEPACAAICEVASCADEDIASAVGTSVASGNTGTDDDDLEVGQPCNAASIDDHVMIFTAPETASYSFYVHGVEAFSLAIFRSCTYSWSCTSGDSLEYVYLSHGQSVLIVVEGDDGVVGDWVLDITVS